MPKRERTLSEFFLPRHRHIWLWASLLSAALNGLVGGDHALAATEASLEPSASQWHEGARAYRAGRYDRAIASFESAYHRAPSAVLLFYLGCAYRQRFRATGRPEYLVTAERLFSRFLVDIGSESADYVAASDRRQLDEMVAIASRYRDRALLYLSTHTTTTNAATARLSNLSTRTAATRKRREPPPTQAAAAKMPTAPDARPALVQPTSPTVTSLGAYLLWRPD
jgi:tetratricopeptide (TPR) repeat protein